MKNEWNLMNSVHSSERPEQKEHVGNKRFKPPVKLNFNRFETMPPFQLDDNSMSTISDDEKEEEIGNILCESPLPTSDNEIIDNLDIKEHGYQGSEYLQDNESIYSTEQDNHVQNYEAGDVIDEEYIQNNQLGDINEFEEACIQNNEPENFIEQEHEEDNEQDESINQQEEYTYDIEPEEAIENGEYIYDDELSDYNVQQEQYIRDEVPTYLNQHHEEYDRDNNSMETIEEEAYSQVSTSIDEEPVHLDEGALTEDDEGEVHSQVSTSNVNIEEEYLQVSISNDTIEDGYSQSSVSNDVTEDQYSQASTSNDTIEEEHLQASISNHFIEEETYPKASISNNVIEEETYSQNSISNYAIEEETYSHASTSNDTVEEEIHLQGSTSNNTIEEEMPLQESKPIIIIEEIHLQESKPIYNVNNDEYTDFQLSIINHDNELDFLAEEVEEEHITRESLVDKNTKWKNANSILGSSVPFISSLPIINSQETTGAAIPAITLYPFFSNPSAQLPFSPIKSPIEEEPIPKKLNPIIKKQIDLTIHNLYSYAASPKDPILLTKNLLIQHDIPSVELNQDNQISQSTRKNLSEELYNVLESICPMNEWHHLTKLDLSRQNLTSLANLNTCFPFLEYLQISYNDLKSLSDLPNSLVYLYASSNSLSEVDFHNLEKLQVLDVSKNQLNNFQDLSQLKGLRILNANYNSVTSCKYFQNLPGLVKLSLKANCIRRLINFESITEDNQLETLDVSFNRIECLDSIEGLTKLCHLNAEYNNIKYVQLKQPIEKLFKLQLSFNKLKSIDLTPFPAIRTLYLDNNSVQHIIGASSMSRIESLSLRDQQVDKVDYNVQYFRGARKLYLSNSSFSSIHRLFDFYSLEYLELCALNIEHLPEEFSKHVPNLSTLYLSSNRLTDIKPLRKLKYLKRLVLIDNRLINVNHIVSVVQHLKRLRYLDLRQNPVSSNIYPAMNIKSILNQNISAYVISALDETWEAKDNEFQLDLSQQWLTRRNNYRSLIIRNCPKLIELDHVKLNSNERLESDLTTDDFSNSKTPSFDSQQS